VGTWSFESPSLEQVRQVGLADFPRIEAWVPIPNTKASNELVDAVVKKHGGAATLFVKKGKEYERVATTVKKEDGKSAVGNALDANSSAIGMLDNGEPCYGDAKVFGKSYDAGYEPIKDASGVVIGAYFVGQPK
jgi:hypothetical protein